MKEENLEKPCECIHCGGVFPTKDAAHHKCPPHQREKEIFEDIASVNGVDELIAYLNSLKEVVKE